MIVFAAYGNANFVGDNATASGTFMLLFMFGMATIPFSCKLLRTVRSC